MKVFLIISSFCCTLLVAQKPITLTSPDGMISFTFRIQQSIPQYTLSYKRIPLIGYSNLRLLFDFGELKNIKMLKPIFRDTTEEYDLVHGKASNVNTQYKEMTIPLEESSGLKRRIHLIVKAFDDGLAFRYAFPKQANWAEYKLMDPKNFEMITVEKNGIDYSRIMTQSIKLRFDKPGAYTILPGSIKIMGKREEKIVNSEPIKISINP